MKTKHSHHPKIKCVVKRKGHCQKYDERKVYGSAYGACMMAELDKRSCEKIASAVSKSVTRFVRSKKEIDSSGIFKKATSELKKRDKDAAFMYETHRDIS